jgi:uncharacterized protein with PIN domain
MVIDTSALIAILLNESEADQFANAIALDERRLLSAASALETGIVIEARKGPAGGRELDLLLHRARIEIVPLTAAQVRAAPGAASGAAIIRQASTLAIAAPMRYRSLQANPCYSRDRILR